MVDDDCLVLRCLYLSIDYRGSIAPVLLRLNCMIGVHIHRVPLPSDGFRLHIVHLIQVPFHLLHLLNLSVGSLGVD